MSSLRKLVSPRSIAVIGGGTWCANLVREGEKIGFSGDIWAVHPSKTSIGGRAAYASIDDLPAPPDVAFVGVNCDATVAVVGELSARGAGAAVAFAAGFAETDTERGARLQQELIVAAGDMPVMGPNCYGLVNALDRVALWPDQHGMVAVHGGVAIISQSSNVGINLTMQQRGLPLAFMAAVGNQAMVDTAALACEVLRDERVSALGLLLEGVGDIARFADMATLARELNKPVVVLKLGASNAARSAAKSHTGAIAGSEAGASALFSRLGLIQVSTLEVMVEALKIVHLHGTLRSRAIGSLSCSGGEAGLMADAALRHDLTFPPLSAAQCAALRGVLGDRVALANPLDYHTYIWGDKNALTRCYTAMAMGSDLALVAVVVDFPRLDRCSSHEWDMVIDAVHDAQRATGVPFALIASLPENMPEEIAMKVARRGIIALCGMEAGMAALSLTAGLGASADAGAGVGGAPRPILRPRAAGDTHRPSHELSEAEAKQQLATHGLTVPLSMRASGVDEAVAMAQRLGYPLVLKGEGALHKTEAGLVVTDLQDCAAVRAAAMAMPADSFLVEQMITESVTELLVGVVHDEAHGFVLTVGAGGVLSEVMRDAVSLLVPASDDEIGYALRRLRIAPLLAGYRGGRAVSTTAVVRAVSAIQSYVQSNHERVLEVEVNPLLCTPTDAIAVDAMVRLTASG